MSWNPFSRASSSSFKKSVLPKSAQKDFERELKHLDELEEQTRRLYKDGKRMVEANNALAKTERKLTQDLLPTLLCQSEDEFRTQIENWDSALTKMDMQMGDLNNSINRTVLDPLKKFVSMFPYAQVAIKKREQALQEFQKNQDKVSKYQERDRTGQNLVKLNTSKKSLSSAQSDFESQNSCLCEDIPKMVDSRTDYFQPSLEALIKSQVQYTTEAVKVYGELSNILNGHCENSKHDYKSQIQQGLGEIRALAITTD